MESSEQQTVEQPVRLSPALMWNKKKPQPPASSKDNASGDESEPSGEQEAVGRGNSTRPARKKKKRKRGEGTAASLRRTTGAVAPYAQKHYVLLSTKARKSIQLALSELSHIRTKNGSSMRTIKLFIEEALTEWLSSPKAAMDPATDRVQEHADRDADPYRTFNNVIDLELKNAIKDICHERNKACHPVRTMIAILDEAFLLWLPKQEDLPKEFRETK